MVSNHPFFPSTEFMFEGGLLDEWLQHSIDALISQIRQHARFFETLEMYTGAHSTSISSQINLENLQNVLSFFFGAQMLILTVFLVDQQASHSFHCAVAFFQQTKQLLGRLYRKARRKLRSELRNKLRLRLRGSLGSLGNLFAIPAH